MTKVALYGLVRVLFDLAGPPPWWWGGVLLGVGATSAVVGILSALMEDDLKRLLACSTVENVGVIVIGLGLALVFKAEHAAPFAALALSAALLHVLNHSLFKSLLFYSAGAVQVAVGGRDLGRLVGLIHGMPQTALLVLVGAAAIAALPPLNGFVSEWLTFQAILAGPRLPQWELKIGIAIVGAVLALAVALAAACFVRAYGIAFLGRPRSAEAAGAREVGRSLRLAMAPAGLSVVLGVLPALGIGLTLVAGVSLVTLSILLVLPVTAQSAALAREDLALALSVVLLGLLMMITRRNAVSQVVGFMSIENGLILAAIGVQGMPLVVEMSVAFSVMVAFIIFGVFFFHIRERFDSLDLQHLETSPGEMR